MRAVRGRIPYHADQAGGEGAGNDLQGYRACLGLWRRRLPPGRGLNGEVEAVNPGSISAMNGSASSTGRCRHQSSMANTISFFRIAAGIVLLFCPAFSPAFYVFYIAAGVSDMLDGFVARKTDTVSELGARLDTMADFVLVVVCLIKLLPVLRIPAWLYGWIGIIALIKVANIISGFTAQKKLVTVHSVMNKATGVLLFMLPLTIPAVLLKYSAIVVCSVATFAAIQEGHFIRTGRE